MTIVIER